MSEAKHTPGPWIAAPYSSVVGCPITAQPDKNKTTILVAGTRSAMAENVVDFQKEIEANARLIAAAPDLLKRVYQYRSDMLHPVTDSGSIERRIEAIDAVISKITGGSHE